MKKKLIPKPYNDFFTLIKIWVGLLVLGIILLQFDNKHVQLLAMFVLIPVPFMYFGLIWNGTDFYASKFNNYNSNYIQILGILLTLLSWCYVLQIRSTELNLSLILSETFELSWLIILIFGGVTWIALNSSGLDSKFFFKSFLIAANMIGILTFGAQEGIWESMSDYDDYSSDYPTEEEIKLENYYKENAGYIGLFLQKIIIVYLSIIIFCKIKNIKLGFKPKN